MKDQFFHEKVVKMLKNTSKYSHLQKVRKTEKKLISRFFEFCRVNNTSFKIRWPPARCAGPPTLPQTPSHFLKKAFARHQNVHRFKSASRHPPASAQARSGAIPPTTPYFFTRSNMNVQRGHKCHSASCHPPTPPGIECVRLPGDMSSYQHYQASNQ